MQEYITKGIVLATETSGEQDTRFSVFTEKYGKLVARAKSTRKITSKLAAHLQPGSISTVRFVEQKGLQLVDALRIRKVAIRAPDLFYIDQMVHEAEPDLELWNALTENNFSWSLLLQVLGWDPAHAGCVGCGRNTPRHFRVKTQEFFCTTCSSKVRAYELISIE